MSSHDRAIRPAGGHPNHFLHISNSRSSGKRFSTLS
jgi:hypothetical protein